MTVGSKIVEDFATALTQMAVFFFPFPFLFMTEEPRERSCASDSSNIHAM